VLGFGRLVDDSIVVLDNIQRRSVGSDSPVPIGPAVGEIALPVVASTVTTVGALVPTAFLPEELKPYFIEFSLAVGISLLMSLVVSFTLIPVVAGKTRLTPLLPDAYARVGDRAIRTYGWLLRKILAHKVSAVLFVVWLFGVPVWLPGKPAVRICVLLQCDMGATVSSSQAVMNTILEEQSFFFAKVNKGEIGNTGGKPT
jgi:multidrug efflux pump subunit AcrB